MALRGTLTHRKTRRLAKILNIHPCFALGLLEALWHVTAEQQPDGGIGRMSDQDIADEMFYEGDATELISALHEAGWIDKHALLRFIIHDWQDHADQSVKRKVARHGSGFVSHDESCLVMASSPVPVPEPVPETVTPPTPSRGKRQNFVPPTLEEVEPFMAELGLPPSFPQKFMDHYQARGWKLNRGVPMTDWRAACRTWKHMETERQKTAMNGKPSVEQVPARRPA